MNKHALMHRAKSEYAYAYDENTLHITFRSAKNDLKNVSIIYGDPFNWENKTWKNYEQSLVKRYQTSLFDFYFIAIKPEDLRTKYIFILTDNDDNKYLYGAKKTTIYSEAESLNLENFFNYPYINKEDLHHTPSWVKDTVWYQIFPDRFYTENTLLPWGKTPVNNNEIYGGNIKGITAKIPYLKNLGITGIYFTPIFEAKTAHKYDTINYFKIDPSFGTNEDFRELVETAHASNIKIMLDGVFNHSGFLHPYFQDVVKNGEESIYKNSFFIEKFPVVNFPLTEKGEPARHTTKDLNFKTFAYTPHMPKWNTDDKLAKKHLLEVIEFWIKEYDIDGWRLDVSNEVSHDFLREIKKTSRAAKADTFILGENWDQSIPWLQGDQMDSVMNYDLVYPLWEYLQEKIDLSTFTDIVSNYLATTPKNAMENMFNLIDSHDTIRILRRLKDNIDKTKLAYLFMFLSAGAPNIYYGGEVGLTGEHDPDNRRCMIWDEDKQDLDLFNFIQTLINLRDKYEVFKDYDYNFISNDVLMFTKEKNNQKILTIMNNTNETKEIILDDAEKGNYLNLFTNISSYCDKITLDKNKFILLLKED